MKRTMACILILALLLTAIPMGSLASSTSAAVATATTGTVHGGWLRLRQQPNFSAATLTSYYTGTVLTLHSYANGWYRVTGPDGKVGYCYAYYITPGGTVTPPTTGGYDAWVTSGNGKSVRMRTGPSTSYRVVASYPVGTQVRVINQGANWSYIQIGSRIGYMMSQFLTNGSPITPPSGSYTARVTSNNGYGVRLRTGPSRSNSIIGVYSVGTTVVVLNHGPVWDYIRIGTRNGYMMNEFLTTIGQIGAVTGVTLNDYAPTVGGTLYVGSITPADATVTYSWRTVRSGVETEIYTGASYTPAATDIGAQIKLVVTGTGYYTGSASTTTTSVVVASQAISGVTINNMSPAVGDVLAAVITPSTAKADYVWYVNGVQRTTNPTYPVSSGDVNARIRVSVTGKSGYTGSQTSLDTNLVTATGTVTGATIDNMSPKEGDTLTASPVPVTATVSYRWLDGVGNVKGTGKTYTVTAKDATDGITLRAEVTGQGNYSGSSILSSPTATVVNATPLTGLTLKPNQPYLGDTITVDAITPNTATETNLTDYHWFVNNVEVTAAAGQTSFTLNQTSYENAVIKLTVTGTAGYKGSVSGTTLGVLKARTLTGTPTITGEGKVGATLTANQNDIPTASLTYEWFADGVTTGSTGTNYTVKVGDFGKDITVRATASSGYTGTVESAALNIATPADMRGTPIVTGTLTAGQTLTAGRGTLPTDLLDANIDYYWVRGTTPIGAVGKTYVLSVADATQNISVVAVGKAGSGYNTDPTKGVQSISYGPVAAATSPITLTGTPAITPSTATVGTLLTARFGTVNVPAGYNGVTWSWRIGGTEVSNSYQYTPTTTDTLTLRLTADAGGAYTGYVELTNITVAPAPVSTAPTIVTHPTDAPVNEGATATFTVSATGSPTLTYRWQSKGPTDPDFADIGGASSASYTTPATTAAMSGTQYRCVVDNGVSPHATSSAATLTVTPNAPTGTAPSIGTQPIDAIADESNTATFTVAATGDPTPTYRWQSKGPTDSDFADIGGASSASYTTPATTAAMNGTQYRCVVENSAGRVTSDVAMLTVNPAAPAGTAPALTDQPTSKSVDETQPARFSVIATGDPTPTYRWQLWNGSDFIDIPNETNDALNIASTTLAMNGNQYRCVVENSAGRVISDVATLTVNPAAPAVVAPTIDSQPGNQSVNEGATAQFSITVSGTGFTYRWQVNTGSDFSDISGAPNSSSYTTPNTTPEMNGYQYRCVLDYGTNEKVISESATLTVNAAVTP